MPTTTAVFKFTPGDEIQHAPEHDNILNFFDICRIHKIITTNVVSDTIDIETSTRTVVREWANHEIATAFVAELQSRVPLYDSTITTPTQWPGLLISMQVNT